MDLWELLAGLVAPASALVGALGGVALTNRHVAGIERTKVLRDNRSSARDMLFDFIQTGQEWSSIGITHTMSAIAAVKDGRTVTDEPPRSDLERYGRAKLAHAKAGAKLRLFVGDDDVRSLVIGLKIKSDSVTEVLSPIFELLLDGREGASRVTSAHVHNVFNFFEGYDKALTEFESAAERLVAEKIRDRRGL